MKKNNTEFTNFKRTMAKMSFQQEKETLKRKKEKAKEKEES